MANALEAAGQDVAQEAPQELVGGQRGDLADIAGRAVAVVKEHLAIVAGEQACIADGDAMHRIKALS